MTLYKIEDMMSLLRVSRGTLRGMRLNGDIPAEVIVGSLVRWNRREIEKWVSEGMPNRDSWEAMKRRHGWTF